MNIIVRSFLILVLVFSSMASRADLSIAPGPLFLTTNALPNIMLMLDKSGSMQHIVPDDATYDPNTTYLSSCPTDNQVSTNSRVDLNVVSGNPRIRTGSTLFLRGGTDYTWGTGAGQKCFIRDSMYSGQILDNNGSFMGALSIYSGNYLNWYFDKTRDPAGCANTWSGARKPCSSDRIMVMRSAAKALVDSLYKPVPDVRLGLSTYEGLTGGSLREIIGDLDSAKQTSIKTKIDAITAANSTTLAETLSDIGRYFATGYTGNLTLHPGQDNQTTQSVASVFNDHSLTDNSGQTIVKPIEYFCQKSFAILLTDGNPNNDRAISASLQDYTGDCADGLCDSTSNATNFPTVSDIPTGPFTALGSAVATCDLSNALACKNGAKVGRTYEKTGSDYLDDVAVALYEMDLRPDLPATGKPTGMKNNLITYTIGFADEGAQNSPLLRDTAERAGGQFLTASDTATLVTAFQDAAKYIISQGSSAVSIATNSTRLDTDTLIYQARFNSSDWSGRLIAYAINADGTIGAAQWDTDNGVRNSGSIASPSSRKIYTWNGSAGVDFKAIDTTDWNSLSAAQRSAL